jgi:hypothetical protein
MTYLCLAALAGPLVASVACAQLAPQPTPQKAAPSTGVAEAPLSTPDAGPSSAPLSVFSRLLTPATLPCPAAFPRGFHFVGTSPSEVEALFRVVWNDNRSRGEYVAAISPEGKDAEGARCIAIGPHRDFNMHNWCCR